MAGCLLPGCSATASATAVRLACCCCLGESMLLLCRQYPRKGRRPCCPTPPHPTPPRPLQVISLICHLVERRGEKRPFLIAVPASVLPNWEQELAAWAPSLRVVAYKGSADARQDIFCKQVGSILKLCRAVVCLQGPWAGSSRQGTQNMMRILTQGSVPKHTCPLPQPLLCPLC